jgi:hypothetical protein
MKRIIGLLAASSVLVGCGADVPEDSGSVGETGMALENGSEETAPPTSVPAVQEDTCASRSSAIRGRV